MNMKRRKTRTFLTILGVVIGVISVVTLLAVGIGVRQEMINSMVDSESICRIQVTGATGGKHKDRMIMDQTVKTFQELEYVSSVYPTYEMYVTINRMVTILDTVTGKEVQKPICDVATSHMARRNFIGNLYKKVKDPELVSSMTGHVNGSRAFARYREIDEETKVNLVNLIN
jgi:ABC-type antimicrobial peptide transport system permease subunit